MLACRKVIINFEKEHSEIQELERFEFADVKPSVISGASLA